MGELNRAETGAPGAAGDLIAETLRKIEASWENLVAALDGIPEERLGEPGAVGEWSVKDVMGHVGFWAEQAVVAAQREMAGEPRLEVDWQAMNEREAAANRGRSAAEQRAAMERGHENALDLLRSAPRLDPRTVGLCGCLQEDTYEHYDAHAADIRAWRERAGV